MPKIAPEDSLGTQIRQVRESLGLSQAELAAKVGTFQQTIDKIESGITKHSRYLPKILAVLEIKAPTPAEPSGNEPFTNPQNYLVGERNLPVFASAEGGDGALIMSSEPFEHVRRPQPLENVKDGYAIIVAGESMEPEFKAGDLALVHPHLPPVRGEACVFYADDHNGTVTASIKSFVRQTASHWHVEQWNPKKKLQLTRRDWQKCHRIVGKYTRR